MGKFMYNFTIGHNMLTLEQVGGPEQFQLRINNEIFQDLYNGSRFSESENRRGNKQRNNDEVDDNDAGGLWGEIHRQKKQINKKKANQQQLRGSEGSDDSVEREQDEKMHHKQLSGSGSEGSYSSHSDNEGREENWRNRQKDQKQDQYDFGKEFSKYDYNDNANNIKGGSIKNSQSKQARPIVQEKDYKQPDWGLNSQGQSSMTKSKQPMEKSKFDDFSNFGKSGAQSQSQQKQQQQGNNSNNTAQTDFSSFSDFSKVQKTPPPNQFVQNSVQFDQNQVNQQQQSKVPKKEVDLLGSDDEEKKQAVQQKQNAELAKQLVDPGASILNMYKQPTPQQQTQQGYGQSQSQPQPQQQPQTQSLGQSPQPQRDYSVLGMVNQQFGAMSIQQQYAMQQQPQLYQAGSQFIMPQQGQVQYSPQKPIQQQQFMPSQYQMQPMQQQLQPQQMSNQYPPMQLQQPPIQQSMNLNQQQKSTPFDNLF